MAHFTEAWTKMMSLFNVGLRCHGPFDLGQEGTNHKLRKWNRGWEKLHHTILSEKLGLAHPKKSVIYTTWVSALASSGELALEIQWILLYLDFSQSLTSGRDSRDHLRKFLALMMLVIFLVGIWLNVFHLQELIFYLFEYVHI